MRTLSAFLVVLALAIGASTADAATRDCACRDANHNGVCDPGEAIIPTATWIGRGPLDVRPDSFTVPADCDHLVLNAPSRPVQVTARDVYLWGDLFLGGSGGQGVLLIADRDIHVGSAALPRSKVRSGGMNKVVSGAPGAIAIAKASIGLQAGGRCFIGNVDFETQPIGGSGEVGIQCRGDIVFRGVDIFTAGFDIQSLEGMIDASNRTVVAPPSVHCDVDADGLADLPCTVTTETERDQFCATRPPSSGSGVNRLRGVANPSVLIAGTDIDLGNDAGALERNLVEGRYAVTMIARRGAIDLSNAKVSNTDGAQSGSRIWLAATPATVDRRFILKEKFAGDCDGNQPIVVSPNTCLQSPNPVQVCGPLQGSGPSRAGECRADVVTVTSGGF